MADDALKNLLTEVDERKECGRHSETDHAFKSETARLAHVAPKDQDNQAVTEEASTDHEKGQRNHVNPQNEPHEQFQKGNTKTEDRVIRRELYTRPGDFFSRSAVVRSLRQLQQLNYFNPEKLKPDYQLLPDDKTVDLTYEVEEKSSDNVNASIGYSGAFGFTGALGFTINNFSLAQPFAGGAGQVLNFEWQFGEASRYRTFSIWNRRRSLRWY